jgi:hypothetical protein
LHLIRLNIVIDWILLDVSVVKTHHLIVVHAIHTL